MLRFFATLLMIRDKHPQFAEKSLNRSLHWLRDFEDLAYEHIVYFSMCNLLRAYNVRKMKTEYRSIVNKFVYENNLYINLINSGNNCIIIQLQKEKWDLSVKTTMFSLSSKKRNTRIFVFLSQWTSLLMVYPKCKKKINGKICFYTFLLTRKCL